LKHYLPEEFGAVLVWAGMFPIKARVGNNLKGKLLFRWRRGAINQNSLLEEQSIIRRV